MKKRILTIMLAATMVASLAGCSGKLSNDKITIKKYKGLEVEVTKLEVTDTDVENSIISTMDAMELGKVKEIKDRGAQNGDDIVMDFTGKIDGKAFEGGSAEDVEHTLGKGGYIDGFEEGIVGHKAGETFDINVTFPASYPNNPDLAGKPAVFTIKLKKVSVTEYPELTDEIATKLAGADTTADAYREKTREDLKVSNEQTMEAMLQQAVWEALIKECVVDAYVETDLEAKQKEIEQRYSTTASMYGMDTSAFVEAYYGVSVESMAKDLLKQDYAVELISKKEKLEVTDKDYQEGLKKYAEESAYDSSDEEKLKEFEEMIGKDNLKKILQQEKVTDLLIENCKKTEKAAK